MTEDDPLGSYDRLAEKIQAAQELMQIRQSSGSRHTTFGHCYVAVLRARGEYLNDAGLHIEAGKRLK
jgi:hypothetical protein